MREPKYRKQSARDGAYVELGGQRFYLPGTYNSPESLQAYHRFLQEQVYNPACEARRAREDAARSRGRQVNGSITYLVRAYLDFARGHYPIRRSSEYNNCRHAFAPLVELFGHKLATDFGPLKLKALQAHWVAQGRSRGYINDQINRVRRLFKWAVSEELAPVTVWNALQTVPGLRAQRTTAREPQKRKPVPWSQVEPLFAHLSPTVAAMLWLQWYTGARSQSICSAKPEQFDTSVDPWLWRPLHKTEHLGKELVLPIGPKCQQTLMPFLARGADMYLFSPLEAALWHQQQRSDGRVSRPTPSEIARRGVNRRIRTSYDWTSYRQALQRAQKRAGVPEWTPHQLRHARGTLVRAAYGLEGAQAILGHESLAATQIYAERQLELAKRIATETG